MFFSCLINMIRFLLCNLLHMHWVPCTKSYKKSKQGKPCRCQSVSMHQWIPKSSGITASPDLVTETCTSLQPLEVAVLNPFQVIQIKSWVWAAGGVTCRFSKRDTAGKDWYRKVLKGSYQHGLRFQAAEQMYWNSLPSDWLGHHSLLLKTLRIWLL